MRLTQRGRIVVATLAALLAFGAGLTATVWDPYTRQLDRTATRLP